MTRDQEFWDDWHRRQLRTGADSVLLTVVEPRRMPSFRTFGHLSPRYAFLATTLIYMYGVGTRRDGN